jgi:hypothetical protein
MPTRDEQREMELNWPVSLRCPFDAGVATSMYVTWDDVPDWWPCTCGADHQKQMPASGGLDVHTS